MRGFRCFLTVAAALFIASSSFAVTVTKQAARFFYVNPQDHTVLSDREFWDEKSRELGIYAEEGYLRWDNSIPLTKQGDVYFTYSPRLYGRTEKDPIDGWQGTAVLRSSLWYRPATGSNLTLRTNFAFNHYQRDIDYGSYRQIKWQNRVAFEKAIWEDKVYFFLPVTVNLFRYQGDGFQFNAYSAPDITYYFPSGTSICLSMETDVFMSSNHPEPSLARAFEDVSYELTVAFEL